MDLLNIAMRALHILSALTLLGGALAWRFGAIPAAAALAEETRAKVGDALAAAWRPWVLASIAGLLVSGTYNFLHKTNLPPAYHMVFGIKVLLALHVFAVAFLAAKQGNARRGRMLTGLAASGVLIVILSAVLRWLTIR